MSCNLSLVLIARSADCLDALEAILRRHDYHPTLKWVKNETELADYLSHGSCDILLAEQAHTEFPVKAVFNQSQHLHHHCLFLVLFSSLDEQAVMEVVRMGADGFLLESNLGSIIPSINNHRESNRGPIQKFLRNCRPVLTALLEKSTDSIWAKHRDGRYLLMNSAGAQFLGRTIDDTLGKSDIELFPPATAAKIRASDREIMESGETQTVEELLTTPDGVSRTFQAVKGVFRNDEGAVEGVIGIVRDISARKMAESALMQAKAEAEQAALHKSEFLATMSHEIRTPLNAVLGMANLLSETPLNAQQREFLETLLDSGNSLLSIINDILDYSKLESGKIELKEEVVPLEKLLQRVVDTFTPLVQGRDLHVSYTLAPDVPKFVLTDSNWLRQVLLNLFSNAVKHTQSGHIWLRVLTPEIASGQPSEGGNTITLQFELEDTGSGIPKDKLQSIFDSFEQVHSTLSSTSGGTGLGLAICRKLIELLGGRIWAKSYLKEGSTFIFTIRARVAEPPSATQDDTTAGNALSSWASAEPLGKIIPLRILVAEDNATNRFVMKHQLETLGYAPVFAANGVNALQCLKEQAFDLVFMDIQMPELDGYETTYRIRRNPKLPKDLRIIAMTAFASREDEEKCRAVGMDDFLTKPASKENIRQAILKWFGSRRLNGDPSRNVLDLQSFRKRIPLEDDALMEFAELFKNDCQRLRGSLREAYQAQNFSLLRQAAHELKGACMFLGVPRLRDAASFLENAGAQKSWDNVAETIQLLEQEADLVESLLTEILQAENVPQPKLLFPQ